MAETFRGLYRQQRISRSMKRVQEEVDAVFDTYDEGAKGWEQHGERSYAVSHAAARAGT